MEKDILIKKWLNHELSATELEEFKTFEEYDSLQKLSNKLQHFKAPILDTEQVFLAINNRIQARKRFAWTTQLSKVAAVVLIAFGAYFYSLTLNNTTETLASQKTIVSLPDTSQVTLNALSSLVYNKSDWSKNRNVTLSGEGFFKVAKGETFNVKTTSGIVTVLGTMFNVKQRKDYFEVICYEGSVKVYAQNKNTILLPGDSFLLLNKKQLVRSKETATQPSWITDSSSFKSVPLQHVLNEMERQYNIEIQTKNIDLSVLFTGKCTHKNIDTALKTITIPLGLTYSKTNNSILITSD